MVHSGDLSSKTVLVRGATGFLGEALALDLAAKCRLLRLFCRDADQLASGLATGPGIEVCRGDALDAGAVSASLEGVDLVIDAIGGTVPATSPGNLRPLVESAILPLAILLDAMAEVPGRHLFYPSSGGAIYGSGHSRSVDEGTAAAPEAAYGVGKLLAEEMIRFRARRGELTFLIARTSNVYGRRRPGAFPQGVIDIFLHRARHRQPLERWGDGSQVRDYLFIDDFVSAVRALLATPTSNEIVHIATGRGSTLDEVIAMVEVAVGRRPTQVANSGSYAGVDHNVLSIARLQSLTGWAPAFSLREGVALAARRHAGG